MVVDVEVMLGVLVFWIRSCTSLSVETEGRVAAWEDAVIPERSAEDHPRRDDDPDGVSEEDEDDEGDQETEGEEVPPT